MRIGISTSVIQRGRGGIGQYLFALLRGMQKVSPPEHRFVLFVLEEDRSLFDFLEGSFEIVTVPERHRSPIANIFWHQRELPRLCDHLNLDVIHIPSYRRLIWSGRCPRVGTIHDLAPFQLAGKYDLARMFYGRVVVKYLAHRQERIIAVSETTARDIERFFGIPRSRIRAIHNGLEHSRFHPLPKQAAREQVAQELGLARPFFLYVARLEHPAKNHVRLIEAFEEFRKTTGLDYDLAFGGSDWHGAEAIHARAAASPDQNRIRFLGFVADEKLPSLYSAAEAFVYPSLFEGFGMPPVEAMACACPVICSTRGSLGEVVANAAMIINPEDSHQIATALKRLAVDVEERDRLIRAGLARAAEFNWEKTATETLGVYIKAAESRGRYKTARNEATTSKSLAGSPR